MGWFTKLLKGSNRKYSGGQSNGKYGDDRISSDHDYSDDLTDVEKEEIDCAIALSLSEEDQKGKKVIEDDSEDDGQPQSEDDEQLCQIDEKEDECLGEVQQEEDDYPAKVQQDEDKHLDEVQLEEDEQLARAIQESWSIGSHPRSDTGSLFQPFSHLFPPVYRICAGCNAEIGHGRFLSCAGAVWHPECFCCHACKLPITDYEFSMSGNHRYHKSCYKALHHPRCDVCKNFIPYNSAGLIEYRAHPFWRQKYCPSHEQDGTPRCCSCQRMESRDTKYLLLDDGRKLCLECLDSAIMDTHECQPLYLEIQEFYEGLNMKIKQQIPMLLVERQALNEAMEGEKNGHHIVSETRGLCLSEEQTVPMILRRPSIGAGYRVIDMITEPYRLIRRCEVTAILVLYGLPRLLTGTILAHEMMHAWLRLNGFGTNLRPEVEEGICQVLAHMWLDSEIYSGSGSDGASSSSSSSSSSPSSTTSSKKGKRSDFEKEVGNFFKHQIETDSSSTYGEGFRQGNKAVLKYGLGRTLDHIRMTGSFPY
ncbi:protein DA1-related 1-like isoform X2 [Gastrolobium bilobum]|uniref:protein DA1-related 1-like isoform X2 n=1 Tax=Gastrolobium bilobum TaxID=150636 RepID=UPI002AB139D2|nr:protein DA1-related 1-like isoform X2 [Gastrolobium bilobum]